VQKPDLDPQPGDFGQLLISGDDQIDIRVRLRRCKDQGIGHSKRFEARPKVGCRIGDRNVNWQDGGKQSTKESRDIVFVVVPEASAGQNLGIGNDRYHQPLLARELANGRVRGIVKSVLSIEKANDDIRVEDYRHSPRNPSTRSRKSPPVSRHPE
jgi:hypothetical protein